ncbi:MAG: hypothetical protein UT02_C0005G0020 [Parcubacteria group bacterium GW2011_GWC2_38_7]|nr:MAG: hypothetical protein UT02_C0005G0020 [Parcubacteria group bacterium GW2011_GWC2_38_7]
MKMRLELHDSGPGDTCAARMPDIESDDEAETWVRDTFGPWQDKAVVMWILSDKAGIRCVWQRKFGSSDLPDIIKRVPRYTGNWEHGPNEVAFP